MAFLDVIVDRKLEFSVIITSEFRSETNYFMQIEVSASGASVYAPL